MTSEQFIKFREMIEREYSAAVTKHPKFCDFFSHDDSAWELTEINMKKGNEKGPYYADTILFEEIAESMNAYEQRDKAHCLQELAQCGAVIFRMMEFVESEI